MILKAYELKEDLPSSTVVYNENSEISVKAKIIKRESKIYIDIDANKKYEVHLININNISKVENGTFKIVNNDTVIIPKEPGQIICTY